MRKRLARLCSDRRCASCRSRAPNSKRRFCFTITDVNQIEGDPLRIAQVTLGRLLASSYLEPPFEGAIVRAWIAFAATGSHFFA